MARNKNVLTVSLATSTVASTKNGVHIEAETPDGRTVNVILGSVSQMIALADSLKREAELLTLF